MCMHREPVHSVANSRACSHPGTAVAHRKPWAQRLLHVQSPVSARSCVSETKRWIVTLPTCAALRSFRRIACAPSSAAAPARQAGLGRRSAPHDCPPRTGPASCPPTIGGSACVTPRGASAERGAESCADDVTVKVASGFALACSIRSLCVSRFSGRFAGGVDHLTLTWAHGPYPRKGCIPPVPPTETKNTTLCLIGGLSSATLYRTPASARRFG